MSDQSATQYPDHILRYLDRIYDAGRRRYACRAANLDEFVAWREKARPALRMLIGLERMRTHLEGFEPTFTLMDAEELDGYTRRRGVMVPEPDVSIPFWLLRPEGDGPFPLALTPHGHGEHRFYAGVYEDESERQRIEEADRDVAVQAVERGFLAIAPATRGLGCPGVPDLEGRHGGQDCRSQMIHCLLAGRTAIAERVWDMIHFVSWASSLPEVDPNRVLVMGNSGGGVVTLYTAACDPRVAIAVPCCAFTLLVRRSGRVHHCDCNVVPGILTFGDLCDVAGLIAPRHLLTVNGAHDELFDNEGVDAAVARLREIYEVAGASDRYDHQYGPAGHRFYKDLMWPFIENALDELGT